MLQTQSTSKNIWNDDDDDEEKQSLMDAERMQQQQQIQEELEFEQVRDFILSCYLSILKFCRRKIWHFETCIYEHTDFHVYMYKFPYVNRHVYYIKAKIIGICWAGEKESLEWTDYEFHNFSICCVEFTC